jgi:hypothetical protein
VIELAAYGSQTCFDIAEAFAVRELSKAHRQKLVPAGETFLLVVAPISIYTLLELISRKVLHELRENSLAKVHPSLSAPVAPASAHPGKAFALAKIEIEKSKIPT